ncbi:MAG: polysaccharide pyruvyl transferase family protein [Candidatus Saganbacteria bacterium]|nr:polysaccharide pyruvyl transferase family protein [Candidatus Saganbacteria bacterium]
MKVLVSGYYGCGNLGDEAVLEAITAGLRERDPGIGIGVLGRRGRYNPFALLRELLACDVLISGGGSLFQDATSARSLWYYAAVVRLAKLLGRKVMIFAQGVGPLRGAFNRRLAGGVLNGTDLITLRDKESLHELRRLNVTRPPAFVTADPAFLLPVPAPSGPPRPRVGVALRRPLPIAGTLERLKNKYGLEPVTLEFQPAAAAPAEMLGEIAGLTCLIGMRLHALIFAALAGVPLVGIAYDPKVRSFMADLGQPCLELDELARLDETLDRVLAGRERVRAELAARRPELVRLARQNFELFFDYFGKGEKR